MHFKNFMIDFFLLVNSFSWDLISYLIKHFCCRVNWEKFTPPTIVAKRVPKTRVSGTRSTVEKWVEGMLNKAFLYFFCQMFAIFDDFSKWSPPKVLWRFEKSSNMAKLWQKKKNSFVQLASNPFFGWFRVPENQISSTRSAITTNTIRKSYEFIKKYRKPSFPFNLSKLKYLFFKSLI